MKPLILVAGATGYGRPAREEWTPHDALARLAKPAVAV
jgi:hypothetical protein